MLACWGLVVGVIAVFKLKSSMSGVKEEQGTSIVTDDSPTSSIPSIFSDKFDSFSKNPGSEEKWESSIANWEQGMEDSSYAAKWEASIA